MGFGSRVVEADCRNLGDRGTRRARRVPLQDEGRHGSACSVRERDPGGARAGRDRTRRLARSQKRNEKGEEERSGLREHTRRLLARP